VNLEIDDVQYSEVTKDDLFRLHNGLSEDFAIFALWGGALGREGAIIADIASKFEVLANFLIYWSDEHYARNIQRLYEIPGSMPTFSGYSPKIGKPPFRVLVVKDKDPIYTWKRSVSGVIEPTNERIVAAKYHYRDLFEQKYQVHSTNNIDEFLFQSILLLGPDIVDKILNSDTLQEGKLYRDLEGAEGWRDWEHVFSILNSCCRYLVLRNFEFLPNRIEDGDIDFLTDNMQRLASVANIEQEKKQNHKGKICVSGSRIQADIRFIGDHYFNSKWQANCLQKRRKVRGVYVPSPADHFFTLLYHCKVHKKIVNSKYIELLGAMSERMRFDWFDPGRLGDDLAMGEILAGYYRSNGYYYQHPVDSGVGRNLAVIRQLPAVHAENGGRLKQNIRRVRKLVAAVLRDPWKVPRYFRKRLVRV